MLPIFLASAAAADRFTQIMGRLGVDWQQILSQFVAFAVWFFILYRFAYKPIIKLLDERQRRIAESMANVEKIKAELATTEKTREEIIAKANESANALIAQVKTDADLLNARKVQETVQQVETMLNKAEESAALERERLVNELRQEMGRLVVLTTSKVIGRTLTAEDQERLQKEAMEGLKG
jgi:F-type H+-transporting ATPase subunit b